MSFSASGTIAKTLTYASWKGRPYVKHSVAGVDPRTPAQAQARDTFRTADAIWVPAPELLKAPWDRFAAGQVKSGYNAWQGRFVQDNLGETDLLSLIFSPGAAGGLAAKSASLTPGANSITVDFTNPAPPIGWTLESAIAATIRDGDPASTTLLEVTAGQDEIAQAQVVLSGLTNGAAYVVGAWLRWAKPDGSIAYGPSLVGSATPAAPYSANAVHFDGASDWLERDADLTGIVDAKVGTLSYWLDLRGGDNIHARVLHNNTAKFTTWRHSNNTIRVLGQAAGLILNMLSLTTYKAVDDWFHVLASWDLGNAKAHLYINDADDLNVPALTLIDDTIQYSAVDWGVGARIAGLEKLNADVADFYFNSTTYIDITVEANRRKFIDGAGKPVDLGSDGSTPTGTAPIVFLSGPTVSWHTNDGTGGGMTEFGALTDGASSPSD